MIIMSCHGFAKSSILSVILTRRNDLVPYYLSKVFVIFETEVCEVDNISIIVKEKINAAHSHQREIILT